MSSFDDACLVVQKHEGGYSNDPDDHGGATNFGITMKDLATFRGHGVTEDDVKNMKFDEAKLIYKAFYWDVMKLDQIYDSKLQTIFLDQGILHGPQSCIRIIQRVMKMPSDGIMGPLTIGAVNFTNSKIFAKKFIFWLQNSYVDICVNEPSQLRFLKGWIARTQDLMML